MVVVGLFVCSFGLFVGLLSYYTVSSVSSSSLLHPPPARGASIFEALLLIIPMGHFISGRSDLETRMYSDSFGSTTTHSNHTGIS
jgi:hypothetical protein